MKVMRSRCGDEWGSSGEENEVMVGQMGVAGSGMEAEKSVGLLVAR